MRRYIFLLAVLLLAADVPTPSPAIIELQQLAQRTALPSPMKLVCLGDSITATYKHQPVKYSEMLQAALAQKYGESVQVINAGRGGDNAPAALKRLDADVLTHKGDLVFINLGINDSKLARPAYERNAVSIEKFTEAYEEIIKRVKTETGARVVVVGTIACVDEWTIRATQGEKKGNWFGKPEELKRYNAAAKQLADKHGCDYVDLFDYFMAQPNMQSFFTEPDGVHARDLGQEQIALQLMRYLAKTFPAP